MTATADWQTMRKAIKRLGAYGRMWKWGSDSGLADIALAEQALQALERRRHGIVRQLALWDQQGTRDGAAAE